MVSVGILSSPVLAFAGQPNKSEGKGEKVEGKAKQEIKLHRKNLDELNDKIWRRYGVFITHISKERSAPVLVKIATTPKVANVKFFDGKDIYKSYKQDEVKSGDLKKEDKGMLKQFHFALPLGGPVDKGLNTVRLNLRVEYKNGETKDLKISYDYREEKVIKE